jgi:hypothetical protein
MATWGEPVTLEPVIGTGLENFQETCSPVSEQNAMTKLVNRVLQIQAS